MMTIADPVRSAKILITKANMNDTETRAAHQFLELVADCFLLVLCTKHQSIINKNIRLRTWHYYIVKIQKNIYINKDTSLLCRAESIYHQFAINRTHSTNQFFNGCSAYSKFYIWIMKWEPQHVKYTKNKAHLLWAFDSLASSGIK